MARKLKTYRTSIGFFDLAVAAPSMKAALEAWGAASNLFHQGAASESTDAKIVAATMAAPGIVLKRPVGSSSAFEKDAALPDHLRSMEKRKQPASENSRESNRPPKTAKRERSSKRKGGSANPSQLRRGQSDQAKKTAADKQRDQRRLAVEKARKAIEAAKDKHEAKVAALRDRIDDLERKVQAEEERWKTESKRLEQALTRANR